MSLPTSLRAYDDCRAALDEALEGDREVDCGTNGRAIAFRQRCNHFRKLERNINMDIYPEGHAMRGKSAYDDLELSIPTRGTQFDHMVYIRVRHLGPYKTAPLGTAAAEAARADYTTEKRIQDKIEEELRKLPDKP